MEASRNFCNGEWFQSASSQWLNIINPATGELLGLAPISTHDEIDQAVRGAKRAQKAWGQVPGPDKAKLLREAGARIRKMERELSTLLTQETGKPLCESVDCIDWVAACFEYYAEVGRSSRGLSLPPVAPHQVNFTIKEPYGVVAAIVPFNFPLLLLSWKLAPALAAGNTVVCKPPHQNPLSTLLMCKALECLPPGVVQCLTGDGSTGEALTQHPDVDVIAFTGSTETGRRIAENAGKQLKKINMEMGGIDPFIVFEDAPLDVAAEGLAWARLLNAGQVCTSPKRVYLLETIAKPFTDHLLSYIPTLRVGDPMDPTTDVGPLISLEALERVEKQVARCIEEGATLLMGGKRISGKLAKGFFFEPTVLANVKQGSLSMREEIFGPVICLSTAKDVDDAIQKANDSSYGLGCCIYTNQLETSMKAMEGIKAGTFWINDPLTDNDAGPFGGMRSSGIGRELGEDGLDAFRETKHVHLDYVIEKKSYWFPYKDRKLHL